MTDVMDRYREASAWTAGKVAGAAGQLAAPTPCDDWDVRTLLNHMLQTQQYFVRSARGEQASPPSENPPDLMGDDPAVAYEQGRQETMDVFGQDGVIERTDPSLGIAFSDTLLHGWDVARATGQGATMPADLAQAAYDTIHGAFEEEQRKGTFKPEVSVDADASAQEKLLAYTGRDPSE